MFFFFVFGEHTFRTPVPGYEKLVCQCYNCGNMSGRVLKSHPWFTLCWIVSLLPVVTLLSCHLPLGVECGGGRSHTGHFLHQLRLTVSRHSLLSRSQSRATRTSRATSATSANRSRTDLTSQPCMAAKVKWHRRHTTGPRNTGGNKDRRLMARLPIKRRDTARRSRRRLCYIGQSWWT